MYGISHARHSPVYALQMHPANPSPRDQPLPLTESTSAPPSSTITPAAIASIVDDFYTECRKHEILGPIFARQVTDWDAHLAKIRAFWSSALLKSGEYSGRPLEAHRDIEGLSPEHFSIWLRLFGQTARKHLAPTDAAHILDLAGRMARMMISNGAVSRPRPV